MPIPDPSTLYRRVESPVGELTLIGLADGTLRRVRFGPPSLPDHAAPDSGELKEAADQLAEYFAGRRKSFDLPLDPTGTPFQQGVWDALAEIPYGTTRSYTDIAEQVGSPGAVRAVGAANGANPLPIIIPCHRVIGSDGRLVGYGGGMDRKVSLLRHEGVEISGDRVASTPTLF